MYACKAIELHKKKPSFKERRPSYIINQTDSLLFFLHAAAAAALNFHIEYASRIRNRIIEK